MAMWLVDSLCSHGIMGITWATQTNRQLRHDIHKDARDMLAVIEVPIDLLILAAGILLLVSILASRISDRFGIPALLVFMAVGMLAGSEGPGGIHFDNPYTARFLGTVALAYIVFSGGLSTNWRSVRPVMRRGILLATVGVALTALLVGAFAVVFLRFSWLEAMLLGSVMSSTDAAAVFSILRSRSVSLKGRLQPLLELESGSNDPMALFLTTMFIALSLAPDFTWGHALLGFVQQMLFGGLLGWLLGKGAIHLVNRVGLSYEGLYPVLTLTAVLLVYGIAEFVGGNGILSVYVAGLVIGNSHFLHKRSLTRFHDGLAWLMQITMFLSLGLLVFPSSLVPVIAPGLIVAAVLIVLARPIAVFICLTGSGYALREKVLISWVGLRGAVPVILATFVMVAGLDRAYEIFNVVFFVVIASALLQGTSLPWVAKKLGLDRPLRAKVRHPLEFEYTSGSIDARLHEINLPHDSPAANKRLIELGLPQHSLVVLVNRGGTYLVPNGNTVIIPGDTLLMLFDPTGRDETLAKLGAKLPEDQD